MLPSRPLEALPLAEQLVPPRRPVTPLVTPPTVPVPVLPTLTPVASPTVLRTPLTVSPTWAGTASVTALGTADVTAEGTPALTEQSTGDTPAAAEVAAPAAEVAAPAAWLARPWAVSIRPLASTSLVTSSRPGRPGRAGLAEAWQLAALPAPVAIQQLAARPSVLASRFTESELAELDAVNWCTAIPADATPVVPSRAAAITSPILFIVR